jgi:hypothetical protein
MSDILPRHNYLLTRQLDIEFDPDFILHAYGASRNFHGLDAELGLFEA